MSLKKTTKLTAGAAAAAVALMGVGVGSAVADPQAVNPSSITQKTGTINVHKYSQPATEGAVGDGTTNIKPPADAKPIQGITFNALQVEGIDLTTNAGWQTAANIATAYKDNTAQLLSGTTPYVPGGAAPTAIKVGGQTYNLVKPGEGTATATTDAQGLAALANIPVGLYLVYENQPTGQVNVGGQEVDGSEVKISNPFFTTVPMTDQQNLNNWVYTIEAYPKNSLVSKPTKTVNDNTAGFKAGDVVDQAHITYTLSQKIPNAAEFAEFQIIDKFTTGDLKWIGGPGDTQDTVSIVSADGQTTTPLTLTTDYTIDNFEGKDGNTYFTVSLTEAGLKKLVANQGGEVVWKFNVLANQKAADGWDVPNQVGSVVTPGNTPSNKWNPKVPPEKPELPNPGPKVESYYASFNLNKVKNDGKTPLAGAEFQLYECTPGADGSYILADKPISVNGSTTITSTADGVKVQGLLVNDFRDNSATITEKSDNTGKPWKDAKVGDEWAKVSYYCLKETKAPGGYELNPQPTAFQLTKNGATNAKLENITIINVPERGGFELPKTGGTGIIILAVAGGLLVAGAGAYGIAANRKRKDA